jgi:hypothetical protein
VRAAQETASRLDLKKTTQVMKNLELDSKMVDDEAMAPVDMTTMPQMDVDDDDVVSIDSQPESHKRPRSPVADDERASSEFVQILEDFHADKVAEKQKALDWADDVEGLDLFGDVEEVMPEWPLEPLTFEDTLMPVPKIAFPHFDEQFNVREMCPQKGIIFVQPNLDQHAQGEGVGLIFKPCGHFDVIKSDQKWFLPFGYCLVDQGYGLEAHWGDCPRVEPGKKYRWVMDPNNMWQRVWKTWEGSFSYTDMDYRQECDKTSILGRSVHLTLTTDPTLTKSAFIARTCSKSIDTFAYKLAENKYLAHSVDCVKCKSKNHQDWILDSGASEHYTNCRQDLVDFELLDSEQQVQTASALVPMIGKGTIFLSAMVNGKAHTIRIYLVYYCPKFKTKLLSLGLFLQNGHKIRGDSEKLLLITADGSTSIEARPHSRGQTLFWVRTDCKHPADKFTACSVVYSAGFETWHQRLGHPSNDVIKKAIAFTKNFPSKLLIPKEPCICKGCVEGKMPSASFPKSDTRAKRPFDLIHSDVKSFPIKSYHKYRYFVSFLDDYSSYCWIVCLKTKDEVFKTFKQFVTFAERQYNCKVKKIMSDFGGEYKSLKFGSYVKSLGIEVQNSAPRTPEQNGRAERLNRTIMDKAEAMRHMASLPPSWWEFAVGVAVYVYN